MTVFRTNVSPPGLCYRSLHAMIHREGYFFKPSCILWLFDWRKPENLISLIASTTPRVAFLLFNFESVTVDIHFWASHLFSLCSQWKELDVGREPCFSPRYKNITSNDKSLLCVSVLLPSKCKEINPTLGVTFHWPLISKVPSKGILFLSPACVLHFIIWGTVTDIWLQLGRNYTYKLFADDLQQTGEAKEIGSHLNDDLQNLLKYGIGFPWSDATMKLLPLISGE